jgi:hypothetical protein
MQRHNVKRQQYFLIGHDGTIAVGEMGKFRVKKW